LLFTWTKVEAFWLFVSVKPLAVTVAAVNVPVVLGEVASITEPVPVTVQFAAVGAAVLPLLLQSTLLLAIVASPSVPELVIVPPVRPLLVATEVTVPVVVLNKPLVGKVTLVFPVNVPVKV
jgi:hypothetical protein